MNKKIITNEDVILEKLPRDEFERILDYEQAPKEFQPLYATLIGARIYKIRRNMNMTQAQFADELSELTRNRRKSFSRFTLSKYESGERVPNAYTRSVICLMASMPSEYLFTSVAEKEIIDSNAASSSTPTYYEKFSNCLRELMIEKNLTVAQLAEKMEELSDSPIDVSTVYRYINGINFPRTKALRILCKIFDKPENYFNNYQYKEGESDDLIVNKETKASEIEAILSLHDGEPLWCQNDKTKYPGRWAIVDAEKKVLIFSAEEQISFSDVDFPVFYSEPTFARMNGHPASLPLTVPQIRKVDGWMWVEPISGKPEDRFTLRDWGWYCANDYSIRLSSGGILPLQRYGVDFLCFSDYIPYSFPYITNTGDLKYISKLKILLAESIRRGKKRGILHGEGTTQKNLKLTEDADSE